MPKESGTWFKLPDMGGSKTQVLDGDAPQVSLPNADFAADAVYVQDGMDLRMTGPDGEVVIIRGYFDGNPPVLTTPEGGQLSPSLVRSFTLPEHAGEYAGPMGDAPAVGEVYKLEGDAWVTHADGTREALELGAPIFQGDTIETGADGAVNILFDDETRFAVSQDARLSVDEFNFTPGEGGESNFSMLKGVFVYTSGLIGKEDPDDVEINTPVGSIGIRGTIVGGVISPDGSEITVIEGSITFTNGGGIVVLDDSRETLVANDFSTTATNVGTLDSAQVESTYSSLSGVANDMYTAIATPENNGQTEAAPEAQATDAPATDAPPPAEAAPGDAPTGDAPTGDAPPPPPADMRPPAEGDMPPPPEGELQPPPPEGELQPPPPEGELQPPPPQDGTVDGNLDGSADVLINEQPAGSDPILANDSTVPTGDTAPPPPPPGGDAGATLPPPPPPPPPADGGTATGGDTGGTLPPNLLPNIVGTLPNNADVHQSETAVTFDFSTLFADPEGSAVEVGIHSTLPGWLTYDPNTSILSGTPADQDFGVYQIVIRGRDDLGAFREASFTFTVADNDGDIDLTGAAANNGFGLIGDSTGNAGDFLGSDVAGIGDINHDGFADVMVGAPGAEVAYVLFGTPQGLPRNLDVSSLNGTNGFSISGINGALGLTVTGLGDIDGDGLDDYAIGAPEADSVNAASGGAFILYGEFIGPGGTMFGNNLNLSSDLATFGSSGFGFAAGDYQDVNSVADQGGFAITGVGDVNNDGYEDFIFTAPGADPVSADSGFARLVLGGEYLSAANIGSTLQPGTDTLPNLPNASAETGTAFYGSQTFALTGFAATGGDFDGDGLNDVALGSTGADQVHMVYGQSGTLGGANIIDLANTGDLDGNNVVIFQGVAGSGFGASMAMDGDLNGDGFNDLVVGADQMNAGDGAVYIINGTNGGITGGTGNIQSMAGGDYSHRIDGGTNDQLGFSVAFAGDVNGDGYDDLIVGADDGGSQSNAYILWGSAGGISLTNIDSGGVADGMNVFTTPYTGTGFSVSGAGDLNGDGFDDVIIGAPNSSATAGGSTVIYGGNYTGAADVMGTDANDVLQAVNGAGQDVIVSGAGDDTLIGDGGADVYRMGAGNDKVAIADGNYLQIDGGSGEDELYLNGAFTLDLSIDGTQNRVEGIEVFNMANGLTNTLRLGLEDILQSDINEIVVLGDASDTFQADFSGSDFMQVGFDQAFQDQGTLNGFRVFGNDAVTVLVDSNIGTVNVTL